MAPDDKKPKTTEEELNELTGMIDDALTQLSNTVQGHKNSRRQKSLSDLVDDLFRVQKEAEDAVKQGKVPQDMPTLTPVEEIAGKKDQASDKKPPATVPLRFRTSLPAFWKR